MRLFCILAAFLSLTAVHAQDRSATIKGHNHSFQLGPTDPVFVSGFGNVIHYFTTPDGRTDVFPRHDLVGNIAYFSGEMIPNGTGRFLGDFATWASFIGFVDQGQFTMNSPTVDSDGNGFPDWLQFETSVNASISGTIDSDLPNTSIDSYSGTLQRGASQNQGSYVVHVSNGFTYTGDWYVANITGTCSYRRSDNTMTLSVVVRNVGGTQTTYTANRFSYTVNGPNQITLPQFTLTSAQASLTTTSSASLTRSGNRYHGVITFPDGGPETSWADFTTYTVELFDNNDEDGDGIPSLSDSTPDAPAPSLAWQRTGNSILITWPQAATGFVLRHTSNLQTWGTVPEGLFTIGDQHAVSISPSSGMRIFRLERQ